MRLPMTRALGSSPSPPRDPWEERAGERRPPKKRKRRKPLKLVPAGSVIIKSPVASADLSPERLTDRSLTTTKVLNNFLERDDKTHYLRHWGLNE